MGHNTLSPGLKAAFTYIGQSFMVQLCSTQTSLGAFSSAAFEAPAGRPLWSSVFSGLSGAGSFFISFMLHMGQSPGLSEVYVGCMGQ